jgi:hypothetical protein
VLFEAAHARCPHYDVIIPLLYREGSDGLRHLVPSPGVPIMPMLGTPFHNISSAIEKLKDCAFQVIFIHILIRFLIPYNLLGRPTLNMMAFAVKSTEMRRGKYLFIHEV